ncbi:MAG: Hsp33 family molecular chaperone HslO [Pseudomonadota bacterium]
MPGPDDIPAREPDAGPAMGAAAPPPSTGANAGMGDDSVLPFQFDRSAMRGRVARVDATLDHILRRHRYPPPVAGLVAEAVVLSALIGQTMKLRWKFSLQVRGDGPVRLIATDYYAPAEEGQDARLRAYASFDAGDVASFRGSQAEAVGLLGEGVVGLTIDQGPGMTPYQGITPLAGGSLSAAVETYYAQSEQLATRFHIEAAMAQEAGKDPAWRAGGIMIQQLPDHGGVVPDAPSGEEGLMTADDVAAMGSRAEDWNRASILMRSVETYELIGPHVTPDRLLYRLFHEEAPRVYPAQGVAFGCTCSAERVRQALSIYSARDIATMTTAEGLVTADCQFCGARYTFAPETLGFEAEKP